MLAIAAIKCRRVFLQCPNGSARLNAMVRRESVKGISNANEPDWLMDQTTAQYRGGLNHLELNSRPHPVGTRQCRGLSGPAIQVVLNSLK